MYFDTKRRTGEETVNWHIDSFSTRRNLHHTSSYLNPRESLWGALPAALFPLQTQLSPSINSSQCLNTQKAALWWNDLLFQVSLKTPPGRRQKKKKKVCLVVASFLITLQDSGGKQIRQMGKGGCVLWPISGGERCEKQNMFWILLFIWPPDSQLDESRHPAVFLIRLCSDLRFTMRKLDSYSRFEKFQSNTLVWLPTTFKGCWGIFLHVLICLRLAKFIRKHQTDFNANNIYIYVWLEKLHFLRKCSVDAYCSWTCWQKEQVLLN